MTLHAYTESNNIAYLCLCIDLDYSIHCLFYQLMNDKFSLKRKLNSFYLNSNKTLVEVTCVCFLSIQSFNLLINWDQYKYIFLLIFFLNTTKFFTKYFLKECLCINAILTYKSICMTCAVPQYY